MTVTGVAFLGEEFRARVAALLEGARLGPPGLQGSILVVVPESTGRPVRRGRSTASAGAGTVPVETVSGTLHLESGRIVGCSREAAVDAVATITLPRADARAVLAGEADPSVLYMQGRLKVDGDMAVVLGLLRATTGSGYRRGCATLEGSTGH